MLVHHDKDTCECTYGSASKLGTFSDAPMWDAEAGRLGGCQHEERLEAHLRPHRVDSGIERQVSATSRYGRFAVRSVDMTALVFLSSHVVRSTTYLDRDTQYVESLDSKLSSSSSRERHERRCWRTRLGCASPTLRRWRVAADRLAVG